MPKFSLLCLIHLSGLKFCTLVSKVNDKSTAGDTSRLAAPSMEPEPVFSNRNQEENLPTVYHRTTLLTISSFVNLHTYHSKITPDSLQIIFLKTHLLNQPPKYSRKNLNIILLSTLLFSGYIASPLIHPI